MPVPLCSDHLGVIVPLVVLDVIDGSDTVPHHQLVAVVGLHRPVEKGRCKGSQLSRHPPAYLTHPSF
jgi:hypothetical protein